MPNRLADEIATTTESDIENHHEKGNSTNALKLICDQPEKDNTEVESFERESLLDLSLTNFESEIDFMAATKGQHLNLILILY